MTASQITLRSTFDPASGDTDKLPAINGLRGVAILAVIYHHFFIPDSWLDAAFASKTHPFDALFRNGFTGVNLFFVLSGIVLYLPYASGTRRMGNWQDARQFYLRRLGRLMPLYYVAALTLIILSAAQLSPSRFMAYAAQILSFSYMFERYSIGPALNGPLWSLGVEVLYSLIFPIMVLAIARWGMGRVLAIALAIGLLARVGGYVWFPRLTGPHPLAENLPGRIDEFTYGMMIARLYVTGRIPAWAPRLFWPGICMVALSWVGFSQSTYGRWPVVTHAVMNNVLDLGFCALTLAVLAGHSGGRVFSLRPLQLIGMMCFSLYVWHFPIIGLVAPTQGMPVAVLLTIALSAITYRYVEFGYARNWRAVMPLAPATVGDRRNTAHRPS